MEGSRGVPTEVASERTVAPAEPDRVERSLSARSETMEMCLLPHGALGERLGAADTI